MGKPDDGFWPIAWRAQSDYPGGRSKAVSRSLAANVRPDRHVA
jgi:hypothetical protein